MIDNRSLAALELYKLTQCLTWLDELLTLDAAADVVIEVAPPDIPLRDMAAVAASIWAASCWTRDHGVCTRIPEIYNQNHSKQLGLF